MIDIQNINGYGIEDPGFALLREVAQKYCPEELQEARKEVIPDEVLDLSAIELLTPPPTPPLHGRGEPTGLGVAQSFPAGIGGQSAQQFPAGIGDQSAQPFPAGIGGQSAQPFPAPQGEGSGVGSVIPRNDGFGIGIPETQKLHNLHYEEADTLNSEQIKRDFPVLNQKVNGHDLVATDAYEEAREKVQRFINAATSEEIIFVRGTTEGINLVAQTYGRQFITPGDDVIVSELDHHANIVPWQRVAQERGATLRAIPTDQNGDLILSEFERIITPRTRFVSVGHVNNTFGTINDVQRIIEIAHSHNIPVLIDGAQSIAHTPVDVQALGADFFVFSGHKIYGPNGIGVVYGRKELLEKMQPWQGGGNMIKDVTIERTEYNVPPARFEAGTPNVADAIGLGAALDYVSRIGIRNIEHHEHQLTEYAREQLAQIPGLTLIGNPKNRVSVVSFVLDGIPVPETGTLLDKEGIAVRAGHHCAQPALRALGYEMSVRPTFALYNTREDVDKLVIAVRKIVGQRRSIRNLMHTGHCRCPSTIRRRLSLSLPRPWATHFAVALWPRRMPASPTPR